MGVSYQEKEELAAYQLKDLAQVWYDQWKGERLVQVDPVEWELFKLAFLDSFFSLELREEKVQEFIKLHQGIISVKEYDLKFTLLSKYAPIIVVY